MEHAGSSPVAGAGMKLIRAALYCTNIGKCSARPYLGAGFPAGPGTWPHRLWVGSEVLSFWNGVRVPVGLRKG